MKKRKILFLGLLAIMLFCGIGKVDAKTTYTAYKAGDKITVNVSDSTKLDFYVIADSDASSSTVEAIMAETSYPTKTSYGNIDITLASYAVSWTNIDTNKVSIPSMSKLIGLDASTLTVSGKFTKPAYAITTASYWLSDAGQIDEVVGHWALGSTLDSEGTYGVFDDSQELAIRPLINVEKLNVVGGSNVSEDDKLWNEFVEAFKNTEYLKKWIESTTNTIAITSTDSTLKAVFSNGNTTWTSNFTYADGVIKFVPFDDKNAYIDQLFVENCIVTLAQLKGYDIQKVHDWLEKKEAYTLETDGIELKTKEITITEEDDAGSAELTVDKILSFSLDIKNGLKTFSNDTGSGDVVVNPKTGDVTKYIILGLGVSIILGSVAYAKSRKYD